MQSLAITQFQMHPNEFAAELAKELAKQLSGTPAIGTDAIPVSELPLFSTQQSADYLGCSVGHINTLVGRYPDLLKPIIITTNTKKGEEKSSANKYDPKQLHYLKKNNLVK